MVAERSEPLPYNVIDLDVLTGGALDARLDGCVVRLYSSFSAADARHYQRLVDRELREFVRAAGVRRAYDEWEAADAAARRDGTPPPAAFDATPWGRENPDFYPADEYERDVTNLLTSVLQRSEWSKPDEDRLDVEKTVGRLTLEQSRALLSRLWPLRNARRNPPAPPTPPDQVEAETPAAEPTPIRKPRKRKGAAGAE